ADRYRGSCCAQMQPNQMLLEIDVRRDKMTGVERDPKREWRDEQVVARGVEHCHLDSSVMFPNISSKAEPSHRVVVCDIRARVDRMAEEVRSIVSGIWVESHHVGKRVEGRRREALLIDIGERPHDASIPHTEKIEIVRMPPVFRE